MDLTSLIKDVLALNAPDLHLQIGQPPIIRIKTGNVVAVDKYPVITKEDMDKVIDEIANESQKKEFIKDFEVDFSFSIQGSGRFRVNIYNDRFGKSIAFRVISDKIPSLQEIGLGPEIEQLLQMPHGLILVTGPTGCGKSTTLASMLHEINLNERRHIITIEDPVEFVHKNIKSLFSQRDVGSNTKSFATALKYALRQDPDIVLIGEMRDAETIGAALTAAETGHLVFGTLHTNSAPGTINRIIDVFDGEEQAQVRAQLASSLIAVISQTLIPRVGSGKVATQEILITNPAIQNQIREDKVHQIYSQMQLNQQETHMTTQSQQLIELLQKKIISKENAIKSSNRPDELMKMIEGL